MLNLVGMFSTQVFSFEDSASITSYQQIIPGLSFPNAWVSLSLYPTSVSLSDSASRRLVNYPWG